MDPKCLWVEALVFGPAAPDCWPTTLNMTVAPGISLSEPNRLGGIAEHPILQVPEVISVGQRTGRRTRRTRGGRAFNRNRCRLATFRPQQGSGHGRYPRAPRRLPVAIIVGQPISHRLRSSGKHPGGAEKPKLIRHFNRLAETIGFEPTVPISEYNDLANRRLQPLGHVSIGHWL